MSRVTSLTATTAPKVLRTLSSRYVGLARAHDATRQRADQAPPHRVQHLDQRDGESSSSISCCAGVRSAARVEMLFHRCRQMIPRRCERGELADMLHRAGDALADRIDAGAGARANVAQQISLRRPRRNAAARPPAAGTARSMSSRRAARGRRDGAPPVAPLAVSSPASWTSAFVDRILHQAEAGRIADAVVTQRRRAWCRQPRMGR